MPRASGSQPATGSQVPVWFLFAVMTLMTTTALGFMWLGSRLAPGSNLPETELRILSRAYAAIDEHYIFELDEERKNELLHAAIAGMVEDLDRYCHYYPPAREDEYNRTTNGFVTGIGVIVQTLGDQVKVIYPMQNGPAEKAGLKVGDIITAVSGEPVTDTESAIDRIKGPIETMVKLTVKRGDAEPFRVAVERRQVSIPSVKWGRILDRELGIGYVFVQRFTRRSAKELDETLAVLEADLGRPLGGLVLDIRRNPGGLLKTCLDLTNRFLERGKLLTIQPRSAPKEVHEANPKLCNRPKLPLVVMLDQDSASASEVLAGALQDHGRARIIGVRSWGKGVVNEVYKWSDQKVRLKLTTSYYLTPKGRKIERRLRKQPSDEEGGIAPDVAIAMPDKRTRALVMNRLLRREVPRRYRTAVDALEKQHPEIAMTRPLPPTEDPQLEAAVGDLRATITGAPRPKVEAKPPKAAPEGKKK